VRHPVLTRPGPALHHNGVFNHRRMDIHPFRAALAGVVLILTLAASPDPAAHLAAIEARLNKVRSPFRTAERFGIEEIIDPRDTRKLLCEFANLAAPLRKPGPRSFGYRP